METANRERHRLALPQGYELGSYQFQEQLGFGSFGITYLAYDHMLSRKVAIKELLPTMIATRCDTIRVEPHTSEDDDQWQWAQERFVAEAQTLAACEHPNVLHVFEAFRANGTAYMVTQFEEGCTLARWLKRLGRAPSESELRGILEPLLSALQTVHAHKFLHRDIKPDNIYMAQDNRPILIDFGSARQDVTHRSVPMTAIVTEGYAPFEQYTETGHQGPWTDLYALAAVMYNAIVGKKPPSAAERAAALDEDPCLCLAATYASQYSAGLLQSIDAGLRLSARSRPQNTEEWRRILSGSIPLRREEERTPTGFPTGQTGRATGSGAASDGIQKPEPQTDWNFSPIRSAPSGHPTSPVPPMQRIPAQGRAFRWFVVIFLLLLGTAVVVLLEQIKNKDNPPSHVVADQNDGAAARENVEHAAQMQADREKEQAAAAIRAQDETARQKQIAEDAKNRLRSTEEENDRLRRRLDATPTPQRVAPVTYTPPTETISPPAPARTELPEGFAEFFKAVYSHNSSDAETWAADFAPRSHYCYANGLSSRASIATDRQKLINRYSHRTYWAPNIKDVETLSPDRVRITYTFTYKYTGVKSASGSSRVTLVTDKSSGRWQVTSFDESVDRQ